MQDRISEGEPIPYFEEHLVCACKFARKYWLPCRYVFHLGGFGPVRVPAEKWAEFISMFDECGFEVYELMGGSEGGERLC